MQLGLINYENVSTIVDTMAHKEGGDTTGRSQENGGQMRNCLGCMWVGLEAGQGWGWRRGRGGAGGGAGVGLGGTIMLGRCLSGSAHSLIALLSTVG